MAFLLVEMLSLALLYSTCGLAKHISSDSNYYTAAVFEYALKDTTNLPPKITVQRNLDNYKRAAEVAKSKGADFIVFPEYGIHPPSNREQLKLIYETVPDPTELPSNPCREQQISSERPILHFLSCLAQNNSMVVVANMGDQQNCSGQPMCRNDGVFLYNTNVVFDRDGKLLLRYHKEHLFFEEEDIDTPTKTQKPIFQTDFGKFATYICFDLLSERMHQVASWPDVDGFMFSTMWMNGHPQFVSVPFFQAWSLGNKIPLFSANVHIPGQSSVGSGVFHGERGALAYTFDPNGLSKLVVSRVPKPGRQLAIPYKSITAFNETDSWESADDAKDIRTNCSIKILGESVSKKNQYVCYEENLTNYTFVQLVDPSGHVEACNNGICCSLNYSTTGLKGSFYLGAFNGSYNVEGRYSWCEEDCVLARCDAYEGTPCSIFPQQSDTLFQRVHLQATFASDAVYPTVVDSGVRLVPLSDWLHKGANKQRAIYFEHKPGRNLITLGLKGMCGKDESNYHSNKNKA